MGLYDRDYMRRDDRPSPPPGGKIGLVIFVLLVLAFLIHFGQAHPQILRRLHLPPIPRSHLHHRHHAR